MRPLILSPIETSTGETVRQAGLRILTNRYRVLAERSKQAHFSPIEGDELVGTGSALERLTAMAPTGPVTPADEKAWWAEALRL